MYSISLLPSITLIFPLVSLPPLLFHIPQLFNIVSETSYYANTIQENSNERTNEKKNRATATSKLGTNKI